MKTILVVEDNESNAYLARFLLQRAGYTVLEASDGASARALLVEARPDLILMDIQLPDISGLDVVWELRARPEFRELPILAVTSFAMPADRERALAAGCTGYIEKPIDPSGFVAEIEGYL